MHGKEYYIHVGGKSYEKALDYCITKGGKLAEPKSDLASNDTITLAETVTVEGNGVWIGINDISEEGNFTYESNGNSIEYTNWFGRQPNNSGRNGSDCVSLRVSRTVRESGLTIRAKNEFRWNDRPCLEHKSFICERDEKSQEEIEKAAEEILKPENIKKLNILLDPSKANERAEARNLEREKNAQQFGGMDMKKSE